jgi:hypothetical protein
MFVPSLSWQNDRFYIEMAQKCRFSQRHLIINTTTVVKATKLAAVLVMMVEARRGRAQ